MTTTRRPAAIMAVDVGGYSEDGAGARVHEHLRHLRVPRALI
jgi:hypothetical protein